MTTTTTLTASSPPLCGETDTATTEEENPSYFLDIAFDHDGASTAGDVLRGHVHLQLLSPRLVSARCQVLVKLEGYERVVTCEPSRSRHSYASSADRCTRRGRKHDHQQNEHVRILLLSEYDYDTQQAYGSHGKDSILPEPVSPHPDNNDSFYSFPFEWKLSSALPGSLFCLAGADGASLAEIRYRVTARLVLPMEQDSTQYQAPPVQKTFLLVAKLPLMVSQEEPSPVMVHPELYPVGSKQMPRWLSGFCGYSLFCRSKGSKGVLGNAVVRLGWEANADSYAPGDPLEVSVTLDKPHNVPLPRLVVLCLETVQWKTRDSDGDSCSRTERRVVGQQVLAPSQWKHRDRTDHHDLSHHHTLVDLYQATVATTLSKSARPSFTSAHLVVSHGLVVTAELPDEKSDSSACCGGDMDSDLQSARPIQVVPVSIVKEAIMAPDDSVLSKDSKDENGEEVVRKEKKESTTTATTLLWQRLLRQVGQGPEKLIEALQDVEVATLAQNLSPDEYAAVIQAAPVVASTSAAGLLAVTMGPTTFTARHLLAGLQAVPDSLEERVELLRQAAGLATDKEVNQAWLEHELGPQLSLHWQAALSSCS